MGDFVCSNFLLLICELRLCIPAVGVRLRAQSLHASDLKGKEKKSQSRHFWSAEGEALSVDPDCFVADRKLRGVYVFSFAGLNGFELKDETLKFLESLSWLPLCFLSLVIWFYIARSGDKQNFSIIQKAKSSARLVNS